MPATAPRLLWTSALIPLGGGVLFWWTDDPFTPAFLLGLALLLLGLAACIGLAIRALFRRRRLWARVLGGAALLTVSAFVAVSAWSSLANRILIQRPLDAAAWRADVGTLADAIRRHPNAFAHVSPAEFEARVATLETAIPSLSEPEIVTRLAALVALLQDGHSALFPFQPAADFHMLPLQAYRFDDGWYVTDASPEYRRLIGLQLVRVDSTPIAEAEARLQPLVSADNALTVEDRMPWFLLCPEVLMAEGIAANSAETSLTFRDDTGTEKQATVLPVNVVRYFYWSLRPLAAWKRKPDETALPLYRQRSWDNYWMRELPEQRALYVAFNQVRQAVGGPQFDAFGDQVIDFLREHPSDRLIIDLRNNSGGDNTIPRPFVGRLSQSPINAPGKLFAIIGRHTFSAAVNFASDLENRTHVVFVGEPTGAGPNHFGDPKPHQLPHSKLVVFISTRVQQWGAADDHRRAHEPQVPVPQMHSDYFAGRDAALEAALRSSR